MKPITVITESLELTFAAASFKDDSRGVLYILKDDGSAGATFAPNQWIGVYENDTLQEEG